MMSRRFKLSNELTNLKNSTLDEIPEIFQNQIDKDQSSFITKTFQRQNLDIFLKERKEEAIQKEKSIIKEHQNLESRPLESFQQNLSEKLEEASYLQEDILMSELINEELAEESEKVAISSFVNEEYHAKENIIIEDSDSETDFLPKKGDKVKVKYSDGWYKGKVHSISFTKKYFWVDFKGFDQLYKIRRDEKFKII